MKSENGISETQLKFIDGRLSQFIQNEHQRNQTISLFRNGKSPADVFRIISKGKGTPKSHLSGKYKDGEAMK